MRILVVLSRVPWPLEKGDKLRAYYLMKELARHHEILLFCLSDQSIHPAAEEKLKEFCSEIFIYRLNLWGRLLRLFSAIFSAKPFQVHYFYSKKAQVAFDSFLQENIPQHIFCQLLRTAEFVKKYTTIPKSMDYMDALGAGMLKMSRASKWPYNWIMKAEHNRLLTYENEIKSIFQKHFIISKQDQDSMPFKDKLVVLPNGVGEAFFSQAPAEKTIDILFSGNMNYRPNVESAKFLVKEIMPIVWEQNQNINVTLAGANPNTSVTALRSKKVTVTGWVDNMAEIYQKSRIFVAPMLINSGMQNKILEAMASGIPCITTTSANNAIAAPAGDALLIGDTAKDIANHILLLIENSEKAQSIAAKGYGFVKESYSWQKAAKLLESELEGCNF